MKSMLNILRRKSVLLNIEEVNGEVNLNHPIERKAASWVEFVEANIAASIGFDDGGEMFSSVVGAR